MASNGAAFLVVVGVALLAVSLRPADAATSAAVVGKGPCNIDEDCNLNGECVYGHHSHTNWHVEDNENAVWGRSINCGGQPEDKTIMGCKMTSTNHMQSKRRLLARDRGITTAHASAGRGGLARPVDC